MQMEMEMAEHRDSNPHGMEMEMEMDEQRDSNPEGTKMEMEGQKDSSPYGMEMEMEERTDLNPDELVALQALLELARVTETGYFVTWGRKRRRSRGVYSPCNSGDAATAAPPAATAVAACAEPAHGSPTTTLRWSLGSDKSSAPPSTSSDSAPAPTPAPRPSDRPPRPILKIKVEKNIEVHKPPNGKGSKKKTLAELKELFIELSSDRKEMEKEKEKLLNKFHSLRDENILLKQELSSKLGTKGEPQLCGVEVVEVSMEPDAESSKTLVMNSSSTAAMGWNSSAEVVVLHSNDSDWVDKSVRHDSLAPTKSCSNAFALPDLNMPAEDVEDLSENQVVQTNNKAIVAAEARKYRMECIRLKHSQPLKVQIR